MMLSPSLFQAGNWLVLADCHTLHLLEKVRYRTRAIQKKSLNMSTNLRG